MSGLRNVATVRVPNSCAEEAHAHLKRVGALGHEGFALWAGVRDGETFNVRRTIIPAQRALRTDLGVCVTVDGDELHRINVWLFGEGLTLIAQLHSHPGEAYHSETDDEYPIVAESGGLSLVLPNFAQAPFSLNRCAVYRLLPPNGWVELSDDVVEQLIVLED